MTDIAKAIGVTLPSGWSLQPDDNEVDLMVCKSEGEGRFLVAGWIAPSNDGMGGHDGFEAHSDIASRSEWYRTAQDAVGYVIFKAGAR